MDKPALDSVSGRIFPGSITGLVGPDGSGKTTLIRLLAGLLRADSGRVDVAGFDASSQVESIHRIIGYMPQKFGLYEDLTVIENMRLYAELRGVTGEKREQQFATLLDFTDLEQFRNRLAGKLSGGMKQKLGLACVLLGEPRILLLDEPSVGVDPIARRELWSLVQRFLSGGMAALWSTSYLDEAERCDSVLLLNEGAVLYDGKSGDMLRGVQGRTWLVTGIAPEKRRSLLMRLLTENLVTDAVIQGASLRIVTKKSKEEPLPTGGSGSPDSQKPLERDALRDAQDFRRALEAAGGFEELLGVKWDAVKPVFEDAYIDMLGGIPKIPFTLGDAIERKKHGGGPVIEARQLTKFFGDFVAVRESNFKIREGEIFGLLGPNGAGKSTIFRMLCGLLQPTSGSASIIGLDLGRSSQARSHLGYMAQKFSLYGSLSVLQNLHFFSGVYGLAGKERRRRVDSIVSLFNLSKFLSMSAETLPLGYKQRLALGCCVMHQPDVLFLDEPTSGVDPVTRRMFWLHINAMVQKGVTVMVTTHFMDEAEYCDRIALIYRGENIAAGTPDELKNMVRSGELPDPSLEDAFISLVRDKD